MTFKYYNPDTLIPDLREYGICSGAYRVCIGCVFTDVPPRDCFHCEDDFEENDMQSDTFCPHCTITVNKSRKRFKLSEDKHILEKVAELEEILESASQ